MHSQSKYTALTIPKYILYFKQLTEDLRNFFTSLGARKKIRNSTRFFIPLIHIKTKQMKSWADT